MGEQRPVFPRDGAELNLARPAACDVARLLLLKRPSLPCAVGYDRTRGEHLRALRNPAQQCRSDDARWRFACWAGKQKGKGKKKTGLQGSLPDTVHSASGRARVLPNS